MAQLSIQHCPCGNTGRGQWPRSFGTSATSKPSFTGPTCRPTWTGVRRYGQEHGGKMPSAERPNMKVGKNAAVSKSNWDNEPKTSSAVSAEILRCAASYIAMAHVGFFHIFQGCSFNQFGSVEVWQGLHPFDEWIHHPGDRIAWPGPHQSKQSEECSQPVTSTLFILVGRGSDYGDKLICQVV